MQPSRRQLTKEEMLGGAWELVRRWPKMSGQDKLAWAFLRVESKGGRYTVKTTAAAIAADQGVSNDAAVDRLANLKEKWGLIEYRFDELTGLYVIELLDAREAVRLKAIKVDPQLLLFSEEHDDEPGTWEPTTVSFVTSGSQQLTNRGRVSPTAPGSNSEAEDPPEEPPRSTENLPEEPPRRTLDFKNKNLSTSDLKTSLDFKRSKPLSALASGGGTSGGTSDPDAVEFDRQLQQRRQQVGLPKEPAPRNVGMELIATALAVKTQSPAQRQRELDDYVAYIRREVNCAKLYVGPVLLLAEAVLANRIKQRDVVRLIARLNEVDGTGQLRGTRSSYFVSGCRNLFRWAGIDWNDNEFRTKQKPR